MRAGEPKRLRQRAVWGPEPVNAALGPGPARSGAGPTRLGAGPMRPRPRVRPSAPATHPQPARRSPSRTGTRARTSPRPRAPRAGGASAPRWAFGPVNGGWLGVSRNGLRRRTRGARNGPPPGAEQPAVQPKSPGPRNDWGRQPPMRAGEPKRLGRRAVWGTDRLMRPRPERAPAPVRRASARADAPRVRAAPKRSGHAPSASPPFTKPHSHPRARMSHRPRAPRARGASAPRWAFGPVNDGWLGCRRRTTPANPQRAERTPARGRRTGS